MLYGGLYHTVETDVGYAVRSLDCSPDALGNLAGEAINGCPVQDSTRDCTNEDPWVDSRPRCGHPPSKMVRRRGVGLAGPGKPLGRQAACWDPGSRVTGVEGQGSRWEAVPCLFQLTADGCRGMSCRLTAGLARSWEVI